MRIRLLAIPFLALILILGFPGSPAAIQGRSLSLTDCSPPGGLQLPVGQGVALYCRLHGAAPVIHVEFQVNQETEYATEVAAGEIASWTWVPTRMGHHTLTIVASAVGQGAVTVSRQVRVVPGEMPVRIP